MKIRIKGQKGTFKVKRMSENLITFFLNKPVPLFDINSANPFMLSVGIISKHKVTFVK